MSRVRLVEGEGGEWVLSHFVRPPGVRYQTRKLIPTHTTDVAVADALAHALEASLREAKARRESPPRSRPRRAFVNAPRIAR